MENKKLNIPQFSSEKKEREFWSKLDLSRHFKPEDFEKVVFVNLKPTTRPISIRLPDYLYVQLKERANQLNIPYQSLLKEYIAKGVAEK